MRTPEELNSAEMQDDMTDLVKILKRKKIPFTIDRHKGAPKEVKELLGYYPTGEWHIMIKGRYSVIRGSVSFGFYEMWDVGQGSNMQDPERYATATEVVKALPK